MGLIKVSPQARASRKTWRVDEAQNLEGGADSFNREALIKVGSDALTKVSPHALIRASSHAAH